MTDLLLQIGLSNAIFSLVIAIAATVATTRLQRPQLAYLLWLLVFVKLALPPLVTIPVNVPTIMAAQQTTSGAIPKRFNTVPLREGRQAGPIALSEAPADSRPTLALATAKTLAVCLWLAGSLVAFSWSIYRVILFHRLLLRNTFPGSTDLQAIAGDLGRHLGLKRVPAILTTPAHVSPMVWWAGGRIRIVLPEGLLRQTEPHQWRWILAHELAHVRRRDHLVRWIEWLGCISFWWNPVVWWAQRNLRRTEEICCDALVLRAFEPTPHSYANSLLTAVEFLARPAIRPPAMASEINSGGSLERRFRMIVSETHSQKRSSWLRGAVLLTALVVLPLGVAGAQDYEAVAKRLNAAVEAGEITGAQARVMLSTLKKADAKKDTNGAARGEVYLRKLAEQLKQAVKNERITEEDAKKKYLEAEKGIKARFAAAQKEQAARRSSEENFKHAEERIKKLVAEGKVSPEDARTRLQEMRKATGQQKKGTAGKGAEDVLAKAGLEIRKAVAEGKISAEEGRKKMLVIRKKLGDTEAEKTAKKSSDRLKEIGLKIRKAVADGAMTAEEGKKKMEAIRKAMAAPANETTKRDEDAGAMRKRIEEAVKAGKITREQAAEAYRGLRARSAGERDAAEPNAQERGRQGWKVRQQRIEAAVESGKMTREEANKMHERIRAEMAGKADQEAKRNGEGSPKRPEWEGIRRRIEAAVKEGKMTREEADAKYREIRKQMAERGSR